MKWKPWYKSTEELPTDMPDEIKKLYVSKNGRIEFDDSKFDGLDEHLNPGVASNKEKALTEAKEAKQTARDAEAAKKIAEDALAAVQKPGTKLITKDEADQLEAYQKLGPPADIEKGLKRKDELETEVEQGKKTEGVRAICKEAGLDEEATTDFLNSSHGEGLELFTKKEKGKDPKTKKDVDLVVPYVKVTDKSTGKDVITEHKFETYLTDKKTPDYLTKAMFNGTAAAAASTNGGGNKQIPVVPDFSTNKTSADTQDAQVKTGKDYAKNLTEQTSTRTKPWEKKKE
jgi:hypothetical protein